MIGLLPPIYHKTLKREKLARGILLVFVTSCLVFILGLIFLLPSYFSLVLSLDDVLRRMNTEEISLKRKDVEGLESKISYTNSLLDSYFKNESKRKLFSSVLLSLTNIASDEITINNIEFKKNFDSEFFFSIRGESTTRNALISYSQKLRALDAVKELRSPVSNLLLETKIKFLLEVIIKPQHYEYKN